ncbi:MAG: TenA family protein [Pseudomonadota bacterium]
MRPTDALRESVREDWEAATRHAFTEALAAGTLPRSRMARYLVEDYRFIDGFVRLLASFIAHAPSLADAVPAAQFLALITGPENTYFQRSFEALGVRPSDHAVEEAPETADFRLLMQEAATSQRAERMLAVLVVAEWTYLDWATPHAARAPHLPPFLGDWITLHSGEGFEGVVDYLRGQLDALWDRLDAPNREVAAETFRRAVALERAFFDAAWRDFAPKPT